MTFVNNARTLALALLCSAMPMVAHAGAPTETGFFNNADHAPAADLINGATKSVAMEMYEMDDPNVIAAIRSALKRGVSVKIVKEPKPVGNACRVFGADSVPEQGGQGDEPPQHAAGAIDCPGQQQLVRDVNASPGSQYVAFDKANLCPNGKSCFEHGKVMVIDGILGFVSSGNFNVSNLCDRAASPVTCDRDFSYVTEDSATVNGLAAVINADLGGTRYDPAQLLPPEMAQKLSVGPHSLEALMTLVNSAQESISLENQYMKEPTLNDALIAAAKRGVKVSIMVASACSFGKPSPSEVSTLTGIFQSFDSAGIGTRMFTRNMMVGGYKGYLHAKAIVIDGRRGWLGSANGSTESMTKNREFGIFFDDNSDVSGLNRVLTTDYSDENAESWQDSLDCAENGRQETPGRPQPQPSQPKPPKPPRPRH